MTGTQKAHTPNTRIEKYGFIADIVVSPTAAGEIFHYIIQRPGSPDVLHWGQEVSRQRAMECIEECLSIEECLKDCEQKKT